MLKEFKMLRPCSNSYFQEIYKYLANTSLNRIINLLIVLFRIKCLIYIRILLLEVKIQVDRRYPQLVADRKSLYN